MKVVFYGNPSKRQNIFMDAGHEVILQELKEELNGLSFDRMFVDEFKVLEDESWKAMIEPDKPNNKPYYRQKERY
jgi:hypothetical protein